MKRASIAALALTLAVQLAVSQGAPGAAITCTDALGTTITLPAKAARVVSLSPAITEILFAAGAGRSVVGVTTYCNYPAAETAKIQKVGGFSAKTVSIEAVIALRPDIVIGEAAAHGQLAESFKRSGIRFAALSLTDFQSVYDAIALAGRLAGDDTKAAALASAMRARVEAISAKTSSIPADKRPLIFWETWDEPLMSAGPRTFTGQIIEAAGGRNCFADVSADWPVVSFEALLSRNPDYIMAADSHGEALTPERLAKRTGWNALKAVKAGRVVFLDGDIMSRGGPRFVEALELMARVLYPESFK